MTVDEQAAEDGLAEAIASSFVDYFEAGGYVDEVRELTDWDNVCTMIKRRFPDKYLKMVASGWF